MNMDEKNEDYGYAIVNVQKMCFLGRNGERNNATFKTEEEVAEALVEIAYNYNGERKIKDISHLRVVKVLLSNEEDKQVAEFISNLEKELEEAEDRQEKFSELKTELENSPDEDIEVKAQ